MASRQGAASLRSSPAGKAARWSAATHRGLIHPWARPTVFALMCLPLAWLIWAVVHDQLGANPAEALIRSLGDWTLRGLVLVMFITPLREGLGLPALARWRRMLGLFVFFYATLHLTAYAWFDMGFYWGEIWTDVRQRPFILVGMLSWSLLMLMALTSFNRVIRWMGARRWRLLHRAIYVVCVLSILHFFWMRAGKNDFVEVGVYAVVLAALLGWRAWKRLSSVVRQSRSPA